ncbi:MAG: hypothetical protein H7831_13390 [Magnetococcus sp. WYHC-3]
MNQRAEYLLQILETIGSPLMKAVTVANPAATDQASAQTMAILLGKTVEASIELGNIMDINPAEAQDDTLRVALAGLAGPLVAGQYTARGKIPESPDIKKITSALQAVLTFSDNFAPTPETVERLKNLPAKGQSVDAYQTQIQYMQAFIPVIEAIAAFPFGQAEAKLIVDVSDRLIKKSVELRETLLPNIADEAVEKRAELGLLRALATLYSGCHGAETEKALNVDEDHRMQVSIDSVWKAFDMRATMLESLAAKMVWITPASGKAGSGGGVQPAPIAAPAPPPAAAPVTPPPPPPSAPPAGGQNPMSMFAKPKADAPPPAAPPAAPPTTPPPPPPPPQDNSSQSGGTPGNPMSFFKKGDSNGSQ